MDNPFIEKEVKRLFWNGLYDFQVERIVKIVELMTAAFGDDAVKVIQEIKVNWREPLKLYMKNTVMIIEKLKEKYGDVQVTDILKKFMADEAFERGKEISANRGDTLDDLLDVFGVGCQVISKSGTEAVLRRPGCLASKVARELGVDDIMYYLHCYGDPYYVKGINPNISCKHNKTCMQGDDCCEYFITVDGNKEIKSLRSLSPMIR